MAPVLAADDITGVAYWRGRAERAETWAAELGEQLGRAGARAEGAEAQVAELKGRLGRAEARVGELEEQVAVLARLLYGPSSEKRPAAGVGGGDGETGGGEGRGRRESPGGGEPGAPGSPRPRGQRPGGKGHGRRDYSRLETREEVHDVPPEQRVCPRCGKTFELFDSQDSEQVDWQVKITRIVHRRLRYRRRCTCEDAGPRTVTAPAPKPVPKGRLTAAFLARLLFEKYVLGRPLRRIAAALAADGFEVAEGSLCGALAETAPLLAPLGEAVAARNAEAAHLHADETGWHVFEQVAGKQGHRWWLWVFLAPDTVVFRMDPTRSAAVLDRHLGIERKNADGTKKKDVALPEGRHLLLSADFFTVYQALGRVDGIDPLWCWAHIRRYFVRAGDAFAQLRPWRDLWLRRIGELYVAHRTLAAAPGSPAHDEARKAFEKALAAIDTARHADMAIYSLHPAAKKVLATLDHEWDGLARHRDFPDLELDNNPAEQALRNPVVGRKTYYGSQVRWSADLAARVWTVTATAERNGREPLGYLTDYLDACAAAGGKPPEGPAMERFFVWLDPSRGEDAGWAARPSPGPDTGALP